jgi:hypothetical protein
MRNIETESFNFDEWTSLAKVAPEKFEQRRSECITSLIENTGRKDQRLQGLQFRIDMERTLARTAMKSCLKISSLMWDSFFYFDDAMQKMFHENPRDVLKQLQPSHAQDAKIIPFKGKGG